MSETTTKKRRVVNTRYVEHVFTTGQVARRCRVAPRTVSKWFDSGRLKGYRIPGSQDRRIPRENLIRFLKKNGMPLGDLERGSNVLLVGLSPGLVGQTRGGLPGLRVEAVECGYDVAVAVLDFPPAVVVIDLGIGRAEAGRIAGRLRGEAGDGPLLVALTGEDDADPDALVTAGGFDEVFRHPFDACLLAELIRTTTAEGE